MPQRLSCGNMKTRLPHIAMPALALLLCACEPTIANRGNILQPDKLAQVKAGKSTREEVVAALGTPTEVGTFDDKNWYYIGRQTEQYSFLDPEVLKQQAVQVRFNDDGVVAAVAFLDLSQARDIDPAAGETPTYGRSDTFIRQLLGDIARPTVPMSRSGNPGGQ